MAACASGSVLAARRPRRPAHTGTRLAGAGLLPGRAGELRSAAGFVGIQSEQQRALNRIGLDQLDLDPIAQREAFTSALTYESLMPLVELEGLVTQGRDRDQAVGAGLVQGHE